MMFRWGSFAKPCLKWQLKSFQNCFDTYHNYYGQTEAITNAQQNDGLIVKTFSGIFCNTVITTTTTTPTCLYTQN